MLLSNKKIVFFTNDVETTSLRNHCLSDYTGKLLLDYGIPEILRVYDKYKIKSTFFVTGYIAQKFPEIVKLIHSNGHEVGSHSYSHESDLALDVLGYKEQFEQIRKSKNILEDITGDRVISFRAPALRVNKFTVQALEDNGFLIDSSVAPQRLDMFFSFGSKKKIKWLAAPRKPYFTSKADLCKKGNSKILEIPLNSFLVPYIGTFMRISPSLTKFIRSIARADNKINDNIPMFLIHPNELIEEDQNSDLFKRRTSNLISYLVADKLRYQLKLKNLGKAAIPLFEDQVDYFYHHNYNFNTLKEYYRYMTQEKELF